MTTLNVITRGQSEKTNVAGAFLVPADFTDRVITLRDTVGVGRQTCQVLPMAEDTLSVPRRISGMTAAWTAEEAVIAESQMAWDSLMFVAKPLKAMARASAELMDDSAGLASSQIASELAYQLASSEDAAIFNGDGTSTYAGIQGVVVRINDGTHTASAINAAAGHSALTSIDATDLATVLASLPSYAYATAVWIMHPVVYATLFCRIVAGAGGFQSINGRTAFWNMPIYLSSQMPSATSSLNNKVVLLVGSMEQACTLASRRDVTINVSTQRLFDTDQVLLRATERIDFIAHDLGTNSVAGPLLALLGKT